MVFVQALSSITHQNTFQKDNIWDDLTILEADSVCESPDYKQYIPANALRRLSPVLRMALVAAQECQTKVEGEFDAISVGTALGCLKDTEKFLNTFITTNSDTLSPTAFIQSTHNTIGGQISLALGNHAYNMTHTQNSVSFETALIDALMCANEGKSNILVGAADEAIDFLEGLRNKIIQSDRQFTSGTSFFVLGNKPSAVQVVDCHVEFGAYSEKELIEKFLSDNNVNLNNIDLVLMAESIDLGVAKSMNYQDYSGLYYSSSAFAFHIAHDFLKTNDCKHVLIVNNQSKKRLGLTLLAKNEA